MLSISKGCFEVSKKFESIYERIHKEYELILDGLSNIAKGGDMTMTQFLRSFVIPKKKRGKRKKATIKMVTGLRSE